MDWLSLLILPVLWVIGTCESEIEESYVPQKFKIEGKVSIPNTVSNDWVSTTRVIVDGGQYLGFLRYVHITSPCATIHAKNFPKANSHTPLRS